MTKNYPLWSYRNPTMSGARDLASNVTALDALTSDATALGARIWTPLRALGL